MKKIALISTFCNTLEKQKILRENIIRLKQLGLDVMCLGPNFIEIPHEVIKLCDYFYFTKENPLLIWPERSFTFWKTISYEEGFIKMHRNIADYGWAALNQVKRLSQIALNYDYDLFYHVIYDLEIDSEIEREILSNEYNLIHPRINPNDPNELWEATLHLMIFDRKRMEDILPMIDIKTYLDSNGVAEGQALKWAKEIPLKISPHPIKDKIYYWEDFDFFDYSKCPDYKLFINKNEPCETWKGSPPVMEILDSKLRLFFYDIKVSKRVDVFCDGLSYNFLLDSNKFIEIEKDSLSVQRLIIDGIDYSSEHEEIIRNISYFEND